MTLIESVEAQEYPYTGTSVFKVIEPHVDAHFSHQKDAAEAVSNFGIVLPVAAAKVREA